MPPIYEGFLSFIICFRCKYKATKLIMQTKNIYSNIRKIYICVNIVFVLAE